MQQQQQLACMHACTYVRIRNGGKLTGFFPRAKNKRVFTSHWPLLVTEAEYSPTNPNDTLPTCTEAMAP